MSQRRDLLPLTVYLPSDARAELERRAEQEERTTSAEARRILVAELSRSVGPRRRSRSQ